MILAVLIYWILTSYRYKYVGYSFFVLWVPAVISALLGLYAFFIEKSINFFDVHIVYYISIIYLVVTFIQIYLAEKRHKLEPGIDMTMALVDKYLGRYGFYFVEAISFPAMLFVVMGSYKFFGAEGFIFFWIAVFLVWLSSGIRLFLKYVK